ncbi:prepilin-type N-terminal cleavage/methylation domain-containing protein [Clostridium gasigenes]|uniref:prepilin-type N-terminal cleavage/methylation domain-containing protein n=1 Tax=Clostridium gasigenes TaxID=94869 RepID=UPI001C0D07A3|nr:prepilin-type N-terminal cleavage/methylation domain-containing protein [Clostridium gasigenes]MBU3137898.1 prepilin-type N-terminal cleavage/methylation domain-containing protein [Clostridium gasigenes]
MERKSKGFTIIELMITLALTTLTLGVIYTFFFSNNKTISTTELSLELQSEAEVIQKELIELSTQATEIVLIDASKSESVNYMALNTEDKLDITSLQIRQYDDASNSNVLYNLKFENKELKIQVGNDNDIKILSKNVKAFKIRPLDINMVVDKKKANFKDSPGLEFTVDLETEKGYSKVEYTARAIAKFRNKE